MKLPRWLVIAMLTSSVLSVLAAAGWWWVSWPERTAREFAERLMAGQEEPSWKDMLLPEKDVRSLGARVMQAVPPQDWSDVEPQRRSLVDLCMGRHCFKISRELRWEFTAERGKVIGPSRESSEAVLGKLVLREEMKRRQEALELFENRIRRNSYPQSP